MILASGTFKGFFFFGGWWCCELGGRRVFTTVLLLVYVYVSWIGGVYNHYRRFLARGLGQVTGSQRSRVTGHRSQVGSGKKNGTGTGVSCRGVA